jgi:hypothetical protein
MNIIKRYLQAKMNKMVEKSILEHEEILQIARFSPSLFGVWFYEVKKPNERRAT